MVANRLLKRRSSQPNRPIAVLPLWVLPVAWVLATFGLQSWAEAVLAPYRVTVPVRD